MFSQIKVYLNAIIAIIFVLLSFTCIYLYRSNENNIKKYENSELNYRASINKNREYSLKIDDILNSKENSDIAVKKYIKELNIKSKSVEKTIYVKDTISKLDTIIIKDTIISGCIDTTIGDSFVSTRLILSPPNKIRLLTNISNEKVVLFSERREILNPSKIFFIRWFQKRTKYISVDIKNTNPYIEEIESKSIEYKVN